MSRLPLVARHDSGLGLFSQPFVSEQSRMVLIQFLQNLFHYGTTEKRTLCTYTKLLTILTDCSHLAVIQIDNLPVATHKRGFLLFQIFGIDTPVYFLSSGHRYKIFSKVVKFIEIVYLCLDYDCSRGLFPQNAIDNLGLSCK